MKDKYCLTLDKEGELSFKFEEGQILSQNDLSILSTYIAQEYTRGVDNGLHKAKELKLVKDIEETKLGDFIIDRESGEIERCIDISVGPTGGRIVVWGAVEVSAKEEPRRKGKKRWLKFFRSDKKAEEGDMK